MFQARPCSDGSKASLAGCIRLITAAVIALASCAQPTPRQETLPSAETLASPSKLAPIPPASPAGTAARESEPELPAQELTDSVLYEFLLAEIATQRGNVGLAAQAYADLAKRTRDPRIARRATEIAVFARMGSVAIDSAKVWHETEPNAQQPLQTLSSLLVSSGRFDEALPYVRKLLASTTGGAGEAFMQLNRTLTGAKDKSAALAFVQGLTDDYPTLAQARYAHAQAAAHADQRELALREVRRAQEIRPDWEAAVLLEAQLLQGGPGSGAAVLDRLSRYLQRYPNSREVRLSYARALVTDKRFGEARAEFQKLMTDFPTNTDVISAIALLSMQLSDYTLAESNLKRLLELNYPDKATVRLYLGQIAEEQKDFAAALGWYGEIEPGDQHLVAQVRYAQVLARQGKLAEARAHLAQVNAGDAQQRVQLVLAEAQILREANRFREAFDLVARVLEGLPENPELLYDHAMLAEKIERFDVLEASLKRLIALRPDHAHAYNALGYTLADRNIRLTEARDLIEKALKLAPEDYFIVDSMGWVLYRMGQLEEALKYLQRAFAGRADPEIAAHLAEVLWVSGNRAEAEKLFVDAAQKYPNNETLNSVIKRLRR